jgi:endonuclease YncB( thermonuclease family)
MFGLTFPATVTRVIDGDTVEVEIKRKIRIRLLDCWAPETRTTNLVEKAKGIKSKKNLQKEAEGQPVSVSVPIEAGGKFGDAMTFGRVLGHIVRSNDGVDLSVLQVESGYATKER